MAAIQDLKTRPHLVALAAIILLAIALRLAWIGYVDPRPDDGRFDDTVFYDQSAVALAEGKGFHGFLGQPTAQWPPGYSFLLAGIYKAFGHNVLAGKLANVLAGGLACVFVYLVAAGVFSRRVGLLAAFFLAVFPGSVYFSTLLLTESIVSALMPLLVLLLLMWIVERGTVSAARALLLGGLLGVLALIRAEAPVMVLVSLVALRLALPTWRGFARLGAFLVLGAALVVLPWTVRNAVTMKAFIPISSGGGHTLLLGQQHDPYGASAHEINLELQEGYQDLPFPEREIKIEQKAFREGLEFLVTHPLLQVPLAFEKLYRLYENDSAGAEWIRGFAVPPRGPGGVTGDSTHKEVIIYFGPAAKRNLSLLADGFFYLIMLWTLVGAPFWFSFRDRKRLLLVLVAVGWTGAHLLFIPGPRYHVPLMPVFCIWAAIPLIAIWDWLQEGKREKEGNPPAGES